MSDEDHPLSPHRIPPKRPQCFGSAGWCSCLLLHQPGALPPRRKLLRLVQRIRMKKLSSRLSTWTKRPPRRKGFGCRHQMICKKNELANGFCPVHTPFTHHLGDPQHRWCFKPPILESVFYKKESPTCFSTSLSCVLNGARVARTWNPPGTAGKHHWFVARYVLDAAIILPQRKTHRISQTKNHPQEKSISILDGAFWLDKRRRVGCPLARSCYTCHRL